MNCCDRHEPLLSVEPEPLLMNNELVAGVDEVGRGPLAGPVFAAAVILRQPIANVRDSKALSPRRRASLAEEIHANAWVAISAASVAEIAALNILHAALLAMRRSVLRLPVRPARVLVDGNRAPALDLPVTCIIGGDAAVPVIGAASIVAKVARDRLMARLAVRHPGYGFERNAGYGTPEHLDALRRLGPTCHHRAGFAPVAELLRAAGTAEVIPEQAGRTSRLT